MLPKGSNSGVYLHGLYEVQVFDSWASDMAPKTSDCGGIYHRWIDGHHTGFILRALAEIQAATGCDFQVADDLKTN